MTYRIANVRFKSTDERTYPVNCNRADIKPGEKVVVATPQQERKFKTAIVEGVDFKNWNCANTILCLYSEVYRNPDGTWSYNSSHENNGQVHTASDLEQRLQASGWIPHIPRQSTWKVAYTLTTSAGSAQILLRKNGIDLQIPGGSVSHWYHESQVDLLEFCWSFAESWRNQTGIYEDYLKQKGRRFSKPPSSRSDMDDIYDAVSGGSGDRAYLGDGIWIGPGGHTWDEGR